MSNVSRSVYQKLAEENKRLLADIYILVDEKYLLTMERIDVIRKWRHKLQKDKQFNALMKEFATQYFKEHPEYDIMKQEMD